MGFLKNIFSSGASSLIETVGGVLDSVITTKEEKMQLENEFKKAEMEYAAEMRKLDVEEQRLYLADTDSARQMGTSIQTSPAAPWYSKAITPFLAIITTFGTFWLFYQFVFGSIDGLESTKKDIVIYIMGVLSTIVTQIFGYYFGSSMGSAEKSQVLNRLQKGG